MSLRTCHVCERMLTPRSFSGDSAVCKLCNSGEWKKRQEAAITKLMARACVSCDKEFRRPKPSRVRCDDCIDNAPTAKWAASRIQSAKKKCRAANLPFDLDKNYVRSLLPEDMACPLCQRTMTKHSREKGRRHVATIDRINPVKGYVKGNLMVMCSACNHAKSNATVEFMRRYLALYESVDRVDDDDMPLYSERAPDMPQKRHETKEDTRPFYGPERPPVDWVAEIRKAYAETALMHLLENLNPKSV